MAPRPARRPRALSQPPHHVVAAFGATPGTARPLDGGEGGTFRAGDVVLKRVLDVAEAAWLAGVLHELPEVDDLRVIRPVRADGEWVVDGWAAWEWLAGEHRSLPTPAVLAVSARFHELVAGVARSPAIDTSHRWAVAHDWAWDEDVVIDVPPSFADVVVTLREVAHSSPTREPDQLIHGDVAGNVLTAPGLPPAVIDISPTWRPARYADAIVVVDSAGWLGAPTDDLDLVERHLVARAALFRLGSGVQLCADDPRRMAAELSVYERIASRLLRPAP